MDTDYIKQLIDAALERNGGLWSANPEDRIELRTDWATIEEIATSFYWTLLEVRSLLPANDQPKQS